MKGKKITKTNQVKKFLISFVVVVILFIAVGAGFFISNYLQPQYYAVYMRTGDIYFGKFKQFSRHTLTDVWFLQQTNDAQNPLSIQKFENVFWQPNGDLVLNEDEIVWKAPVKDESQVVQIIKQGVVPQQQTNQQQTAPQQEVETSTEPSL